MGVRGRENLAPTETRNTRIDRKICFAGEGSARESRRDVHPVHPVHPCRSGARETQLTANTKGDKYAAEIRNETDEAVETGSGGFGV